MKRILNLFVIIIGVFLVFGFLLFKGGIELSDGKNAITMPVSSSIINIIFIRIIYGGSILYHAISTFNFNKASIEKLRPLNNFQIITGMIIYLMTFWSIIKLISALSFFEYRVWEMFILIIMVLVLKLPLIIFPPILVSKNLSLNKNLSMKKSKIPK